MINGPVTVRLIGACCTCQTCIHGVSVHVMCPVMTAEMRGYPITNIQHGVETIVEAMRSLPSITPSSRACVLSTDGAPIIRVGISHEMNPPPHIVIPIDHRPIPWFNSPGMHLDQPLLALCEDRHAATILISHLEAHP